MATMKSLSKRLDRIKSRLAEKGTAPGMGVFIIAEDTPENADIPTLSERVGQMRRRPRYLTLIPDNGRGDQDRRHMVRLDPQDHQPDSGVGETPKDAPA